jgi:hypothetical protein
VGIVLVDLAFIIAKIEQVCLKTLHMSDIACAAYTAWMVLKKGKVTKRMEAENVKVPRTLVKSNETVTPISAIACKGETYIVRDL